MGVLSSTHRSPLLLPLLLPQSGVDASFEVLSLESRNLHQNASPVRELGQQLSELERQEGDVDEALAEWIMTLANASRIIKSYKYHRHLEMQIRHLKTALEHILIAAQPGAGQVPGTKRLAAEKLRHSTEKVVCEICDRT